MRVSEAKQMTGERREKTLSRLFRLQSEGFKQALRAMEARKLNIAAKTLDGFARTRANIKVLMLSKKRSSLSIEVEIKEKLEELQKNTEAFKAAVKLGSVKDARNFSRWGIELVSELAELD